MTVEKWWTSSVYGTLSRDATVSRDTAGLSDMSTRNACFVDTGCAIGAVFTECAARNGVVVGCSHCCYSEFAMGSSVVASFSMSLVNVVRLSDCSTGCRS